MKRTISMLLVMAMLLGLLPGFAVAAEAEVFEVDFRTADRTTITNTYLTAATKGANWSVDADSSTLHTGNKVRLNLDYSAYADFQTWSAGGNLTLNFTVPADGKYQIDVYGMRRDAGGLGKFYIDGTYIGEEDFYADTNDFTTAVKGELGEMELTAGAHKLTIESAGVTSAANALLLVQRISFTPEGYVEKPEEFVVDFTQVNTSTLNGQYATANGTAKGPNWSVVTKVSEGSTVFNKGSRVRFYVNSYLQLGLYAADVTDGYDTLLIDFTVPTDGKYDISALVYESIYGGYGDIYLDGALLCTYDFHNAATLDDQYGRVTNTINISSAPVELTAGTHQLKMTGRISQNAGYAYVTPYNFTFTPAGELGEVELGSEKKYILLSDTAGMKLSLSAKYTSGKEVDIENDAAVEFESSDDNIATVTDDGTVMPVALGDVTITATVTVGDITKSAELALVISEEPVFSNFVIDFLNQTAPTAYGATIATNGWQINKSKSDAYLYSTISNGQGITRYQPYGLQIQSMVRDDRNHISFDFEVPEAGAYIIEMQGAEGPSGGIGYVYIDDIYVGEYNFYAAAFTMESDKVLMRPMNLTKATHTLTLVAAENAGSTVCNMYPKYVSFAGCEALPVLTGVELSAPEEMYLGDEAVPEVTYTFANGAEISARSMFSGAADATASYVLVSDSASLTVSGGKITAAEQGSANLTARATVSGTELSSEAVAVTVIKPILNTVTLTGAAKYILLSDTAGMKLSVSAKYTNDSDVDIENDAAVEFKSSDDNVATVTADGTVMPVALGEVTITADVTVDGVTKSASLALVISETPVYENFVIDFKNQTAATAYTATIETNGWQINKSKSDAYLYSTRNGVDITRYQTYGLQIQSMVRDDRNQISFDFRVPETGAYNITMQGGQGPSGGIGYIYIDGKYVGEYNFYAPIFNADTEVAAIRPLLLTEDEVHTLTFVAAEIGASSCNMYPTILRFTGTGELDAIAELGADMARKSIAAGESESFALYVLHASGAKYYAKPSLDGTNEISLAMTSGDSTVATVDGSFVKAIKPGTVKMLISGKIGETEASDEFDFTVNNNTYDHAEIDVVYDLFYIGGETEISASAHLSDGTKVNDRDISYRFTSDNEAVATVDGSVLSTLAEGEATITAHVTFNGEEKSAEATIKVVPVALAGIAAETEDKIVSAADIDGSKIIVTGVNNDGSVGNLDGAVYTYESLTPEIVGVSEDGYVISLSRGAGRVKVTAELGGIEFTCELEVISSSQKTEPTVYTYEMRENARENIAKYDWAKSAQKTAVQNAQYYVDNLDALYSLIMYEGIPRSSTIALMDDPGAYDCVYCKEDIRKRNNAYAWGVDPIARRWKIQCPNCKRLFPSNEFGDFYKLGVDGKGQFDRMRALEAHRELFVDVSTSPASPGEEWSDDWCAYYGYGKGYLKNDLYGEVGTTLGVAADKISTWAVDDGWGWDTGKDASSGIPIKKTFMAFYHHKLYNANGAAFLQTAINTLRDAYLYTGDIKYGRAGAILVDRIADVYPSFDLNQYPAYQNSHGGKNNGKILGSIWETDLATCIVRGYDAFYPAMDDPQVISYLSEKAKEFNLSNPKLSGDMIRENCEDGILREVYKGATSDRIAGNFGMHQLSVTLAAVALDTFPETAEMLDWVGARSTTRKGTVTQYGKEYSVYISNSGGEMLTKFVNDVDRDGFGNEIGVGYNQSWLTNSLNVAETLYRYGKYDGLDLYGNAKYRKMFDSIIHMTMAGDYTLQLGDTGSTATTNNMTTVYGTLLGFERLGDPKYAQIVYHLKNGDLSGTYIDIFTKNAEDIQEKILETVETYGEYKFESRNLTGFGLAVLSGGELVDNTGALADTDLRRDSWLWYGDTSSGHAHNDMLQMGVDAYGFNFTPDLGYPAATSYDANRLQWIETTLSHNTVVVNGNAQKGVKNGTPLHFDDAGMVKIVDAEAPGAYDEADIYRRTLVSVDASSEAAYTVDFFRVRGGDEHIYSFHTQSADGVTVDGLNLTAQVDGSGNYVGSYAGADVEYGKDPDTKDAWTYETRYPRGYTWLKNVRRDDAPSSGSFSVNFKQSDFKNQVANASGLNLKFTALNDWTPSSVGIAVAEPPRRVDNRMIPYLDYMLIHNKGKDLDTLFTSVLQPYNGEEYIESMESMALTSSGGEGENDTSKAVKVKLKSGRTDYIIYATNSDVVYTLTDGDVSFDFSGFVGVYSVNKDGDNVYAYVNDGGKIGDLTTIARYTGTVVEFTEDLVSENFITVKLNDAVTAEDAAALAGRYVYVDNTGNLNGAYKIESAELSGENVVLNIGDVSLVKSYKNPANLSQGYAYNIEKEQTLTIPLSAKYDGSPETTQQSDVTATVGSSMKVTVRAESPEGEKITYVGTVMPRGASINAETGDITWKPDASQKGESGFLITARDESGRENTISFTVTVYGATTGSTSNTVTSGDTTTTPGTSTSGNGGGGGGSSGQGSTNGSDTGTDNNDQTDVGETPSVGDASSSLGEGASGARFVDLGSHAWAAESINTLADDGIVKGTTYNTYSPTNNITRADYALLLVRAFELTSDDTTNFDDVLSSDYFASELAIARNTGIVQGIGDNEYAPRSTITRQDMMVIIYRALDKLGKLGDTDKTVDASEYPDYADVADYARDAVDYLIASGLVNGKNGLIAPTDYTTRAEVAVLLKRILDYTAE